MLNTQNFKTVDIQISTENLQLDIYGFGGIAMNKDYAGTAFKLSGKVWEVIKANDIKSKGKNIWIYETGERVFAGVELEDDTTYNNKLGLEKNAINIERYAYFKHIGPYNLIKKTAQNMTTELAKRGLEVILPYIEIYGHWTSDETKLETELIMSIK
jgi:effector-binding domain-containing protein